MSVAVDKLKTDFLGYISDAFNQDMYFIESCHKFKTKHSLENQIIDVSLRIFFEENNKVVIAGKTIKYCHGSNNKRKIKIKDISLNQPEINIINNYIVDDKWDQIDW